MTPSSRDPSPVPTPRAATRAGATPSRRSLETKANAGASSDVAASDVADRRHDTSHRRDDASHRRNGATSPRTWWLVAATAFAIGFLAYANTLGHGFVWDDTIWLDQKLRFYRGPADAFFEPELMPMRQVYRPLTQLIYWIDQSLWWRTPFGFHLTSVLLHALNGALLVLLARRLGLGPVGRDAAENAESLAQWLAAHPDAR